MHRRILLKAGASALALANLPSVAAATSRGVSDTTDAFSKLRDRYFLQAMRFNPVTATYLGGDSYHPALADINGRLRDYRQAALAKEADFYKRIQAENAAIDATALSPSEQIDQAAMRSQLDFMLHQLETLRHHERCLDTYMAEPFRGVDWQLQQMTEGSGDELGSEAEWRLVVRRVAAIPAYLEVAKGNLRTGVASGNRPDWRMVERDGIAAAQSNADYFAKTLPEQARGYLGERAYRSAILTQLGPACAAAQRAFQGFVDFLHATYPADDRQDRYATGEAEYLWRVRNNLHETRSAAELIAYGEEQTAAYQARMRKLAQEIAANAGLDLPFETTEEQNDSVRKVMEHLSANSPTSDAEMLAGYVETGRRAVQYGRDQALFDIPADYRLDVYPTPPVLRAAIDAAYYPAPPFKAAGVGRFYLTPTGDDRAALSQNNRASVADTAVHEGFPGHDWHYKYMTAHAEEISNIRWFTPGAVEDSSSMWEDSMATEGWGLYAEGLMAEPAPGRPYGFYSREELFYALQGELLRAVRIVVDVGIHTGRMSYDQAVDYVTANMDFLPDARDRAAADPTAKAVFEGAEKSIYRYSKWPTQAITYNLGKTAIIELRETCRKLQGDAFRQSDFHMRLMRMGTIPAPLYRDYFLQEVAHGG